VKLTNKLKTGVLSNATLLWLTNDIVIADDGLGPLHHQQQHGDGLWLLDMERTLALLVGRCLGWMLLGCGLSRDESDAQPWPLKCLFTSGLQLASSELGMLL
jgi:hypothetical protein